MRLLLSALLTLSTACGVCPRSEALRAADGGALPCATAIDCPRAGFELLCTDGLDRGRGCVDCDRGACVRWIPEACR